MPQAKRNITMGSLKVDQTKVAAELGEQKAPEAELEQEPITTEEPVVEPETPEEPVAEPTETEEEEETGDEVVLPQGIEYDEHKNLVFKSGTSIYKGKGETEEEKLANLFSNISRGIEEKDRIITEAKPKLKAKREAKEEKPPEAAFPEFKEILTKYAKESNIDPQMFNWGDEQWRDFEDKVGGVNASRMANKVDRIRESANREYQEVNIRTINDQLIQQETEQVSRMLDQYGISTDEFDYEAVLARVEADQNSMQGGMLKSGYIVAEAFNDISKLLEKKTRQKVESELLNKQAKLAAKKPRPTLLTTSRARVSTKPDEKKALSLKEAKEMALKDAPKLLEKLRGNN
jgi:hypothetical protein